MKDNNDRWIELRNISEILDLFSRLMLGLLTPGEIEVLKMRIERLKKSVKKEM